MQTYRTPTPPQTSLDDSNESNEILVVNLCVVIGFLLGLFGSIGSFDATPLNSDGRPTSIFSEVDTVEKGASSALKLLSTALGFALCSYGAFYYFLLEEEEEREEEERKRAEEQGYSLEALTPEEQIRQSAYLERVAMEEQFLTQEAAEKIPIELQIRKVMEATGYPYPVAKMLVERAIAEVTSEEKQKAIASSQRSDSMQRLKAEAAKASEINAAAEAIDVVADQGPKPSEGDETAIAPPSPSPSPSFQIVHPPAPPPAPGDQLNFLLGYTSQGQPMNYTPRDFDNGFVIAVGKPGSGKTTLSKSFLEDMTSKGYPCLYLAFHKDMSEAPGVKTLRVDNFESEIGINPFALISTDKRHGGPSHQKTVAVGSIKAICGLGNQQSILLRDIVDHLFAKAGIKDEDPTTWGIEAPTPKMIIETMDKFAREIESTKLYNSTLAKGEVRQVPDLPFPVAEGALQSLRGQIREFFFHPVFGNARTDLRGLLQGSHIIDLSYLGIAQVQYLISDTLLRSLILLMEMEDPIPENPTDRERFRLWLISDEAKYTMNPSNKDDKDSPIVKIAKDLRKAGMGFFLLSQELEDFSKTVLKTFAAMAILNVNRSEYADIAKLTGLTDEQLSTLAGKGDCYWVTETGVVTRFQVEPPASSDLPSRRRIYATIGQN